MIPFWYAEPVDPGWHGITVERGLVLRRQECLTPPQTRDLARTLMAAADAAEKEQS